MVARASQATVNLRIDPTDYTCRLGRNTLKVTNREALEPCYDPELSKPWLTAATSKSYKPASISSTPSGRTITEFDDTLFSLMMMNQHPVHIDGHYAAETQHGRRLVVGPLVVGIVIGLTQADIGGRSLEVLEYADMQHTGPVFHGDTIYAESTILDKRATQWHCDSRIAGLQSAGRNRAQHEAHEFWP